MPLEIEKLCSQLLKLGKEYHAANAASKPTLEKQFAETWKKILASGYSVKLSKDSNGRQICIPRANPNAKYLEVHDNRPSAYAHSHDDCSTRCMAFILGKKYDDVLDLQHAIASKLKSNWKGRFVIHDILKSHGFIQIALHKKMSRKTFIDKFSHLNGVVATLSRHHIAAVDLDKKKVIDTWDSTRSMLTSIYVPKQQTQKWIDVLNA